MKELSQKEQRFIALYTNPNNKKTFGNGTMSVIEAGYIVCSRNMAGVYANRLLRKDKIVKTIGGAMEEFKMDIARYCSDLDRMLKEGGKAKKPSREWLQGLRIALEKENRLGKGSIQATQINIGQEHLFAQAERSKVKLEELKAKRLYGALRGAEITEVIDAETA